MATHSSILAWRIPETEEPSGLPSMGSHRVGHDCSDLAAAVAAYSIYSIVFVSDIQKSDLDSCIYLSISIYTHILFQILFHHGLLQDIAYSSLCFTVEPCCSSVYTWYCVSANPELLIYPSPLALW